MLRHGDSIKTAHAIACMRAPKNTERNVIINLLFYTGETTEIVATRPSHGVCVVVFM